jgi:hypothetical protein
MNTVVTARSSEETPINIEEKAPEKSVEPTVSYIE